MGEKIAAPKKVAISIIFNVVSIDLICGDEYEATVLHEDIIERLQKGEGLTLRLGQEPPVFPASRDERAG